MVNINKKELHDRQMLGEKILVDFYATWCSPCKTLIPMLESLENEYTNVKFYKFDIESDMAFVSSLGVTSVPTVIMYNGNAEHDMSRGLKSSSYYKEKLNELNA